jgi:pimeloyl-ACP methyl ester carboxylesterase
VGAAARFLCEQTGSSEFILLGLRLGGALAARAAEELPGCVGLALIEPVADGAAYFDGQVRRSLVRNMLTRGNGDAPDPELRRQMESDQEVLDLDGFAISAATCRELSALGIRAGEVEFGGPVLVCQIHFKDAARPDMEAVCDAYRQAGAEVAFTRLVLPPFWNRIEITLAPELDEAVHDWITR